jgi:hypothetical protein
LNVGKLEKIRKEDFKLLCDRVEQKVKGINPLFLNLPEAVEKEAEFIYTSTSSVTVAGFYMKSC